MKKLLSVLFTILILFSVGVKAKAEDKFKVTFMNNEEVIKEIYVEKGQNIPLEEIPQGEKWLDQETGEIFTELPIVTKDTVYLLAFSKNKQDSNVLYWGIDNTILHLSNSPLDLPIGGEFSGVFTTDKQQPWKDYFQTITKVVIDNDLHPTNMDFWFSGLNVVEEYEGLNNIDTSNCTSFWDVFANNFEVKELDLSSWDTSKVTAMTDMFFCCQSLKTLDLSNFDTSNVTDMYYMFAYCENLETLNLANFTTEKVTDVSMMFYCCYKLKTIYVKKDFDTSVMKKIEATKPFTDCFSLEGGTGTKWNEAYTDIDYMKVDNLDYPGYFTSLEDLYTISFDSSPGSPNPESFKRQYNGKMPSVSVPTLKNATFLGYFDSNGKQYYNSSGNPEIMRYDKKEDTVLYAKYNFNFTPTIYWSIVYPAGELHLSSTPLEGEYWKQGETNGVFSYYTKVPWLSYSYYYEGIKKVYIDNTIIPKSTAWWFYNLEFCTSINGLENLITDGVEDMSHMFQYMSSLTSLNNLEKLVTSNVKDMSFMFNGCSQITLLPTYTWDTSKVTNMEYMFAWCSRAYYIGASDFNTSNVTNMMAMFWNCKVLNANNYYDPLVFKTWDTSKVTNMNSLFRGCQSFDELDISSFNTSNVTDMNSMFRDCIYLKKIIVNNFNISSVSSSYHMFTNCFNLVGQNGTKYDARDMRDISLAVVDGDKKGYFTKKGSLSSQTTQDVTLNEPSNFATDDWRLVSACANDIDNCPYEVGDTRQITLNSNKYTLRIANMTTPNECNNDNFSQTACGFVVEFVTPVTEMDMIQSVSSVRQKTDGSWTKSDAYNYLKSLEPYLKKDTSGGTTKLGDVMIPTKVITGQNAGEKASGKPLYQSTEYLYLFSLHEVLEGDTSKSEKDYDISKMDNGYNVTRQLDYYSGLKTTDNPSKRENMLFKANLSGVPCDWWLRTPNNQSNMKDTHYYSTALKGGAGYSSVLSNMNGYTKATSLAKRPNALAPAFRIG